MPEIKPGEFRCYHCSDVFEKEWTDQEARREYEENFPVESSEGWAEATVCDDCYKEFMTWFKNRRK